MVCNGWFVAWTVARWVIYGGDQFYRALWARAGSGVSFGACGGIVCRAVGRVAAPAMVVLGDAAASFVHVHFYSLGALSLCGGYFWRNRYRDAGICDWEVDYGTRGCLHEPVGSRGCRTIHELQSYLDLGSSGHRHECLRYLGNSEEQKLVGYRRD